MFINPNFLRKCLLRGSWRRGRGEGHGVAQLLEFADVMALDALMITSTLCARVRAKKQPAARRHSPTRYTILLRFLRRALAGLRGALLALPLLLTFCEPATGLFGLPVWARAALFAGYNLLRDVLLVRGPARRARLLRHLLDLPAVGLIFISPIKPIRPAPMCLDREHKSYTRGYRVNGALKRASRPVPQSYRLLFVRPARPPGHARVFPAVLRGR